jgi:UDP-N-acetyl-D-mannosaminuronate dehydrogenase
MQWEALIQEHPYDMQIHSLHALRLGLCFKVDRGDLTVSQATEIFENMRSALVNAKAEEMEKELEEGKNQKKDL